MLTELFDSSSTAQPLLPERMVFTQRAFWGEKGLLRLTGKGGQLMHIDVNTRPEMDAHPDRYEFMDNPANETRYNFMQRALSGK